MGENIKPKGRDNKMEEMLSEILSELKDFRGEMRDVKADVRELKQGQKELTARVVKLEQGQEEIIKTQKEHSEQIEFILETVKSTDRILTQRRREQVQMKNRLIVLDKVKIEKDRSQDKQIQENSKRIAKCEEQIARFIK